MPQLELNGKILATQTGSANTIVHADALEHATFPSGHIIKSSGQLDHSTTGNFTTTSSTYVVVKESDGSTPISTGAFNFTAGNKVLIMWSASMFPHNGGTDVSNYVRISTSATDNDNFISSMGDTQGAYIYSNESDSKQIGGMWQFIQTDSPSGTSVTYYFQIRAAHGGTAQYQRADSHIHLFEVQA